MAMLAKIRRVPYAAFFIHYKSLVLRDVPVQVRPRHHFSTRLYNVLHPFSHRRFKRIVTFRRYLLV